MLQFVAVILVIAVSTYVFKKLLKEMKVKNHEKQVPGLPKTDTILGNLPDMFRAGSLPNFLRKLHETYGPIASYWHKDVLTVSLADPKYFKMTEKMFDRHPALFEFALPLISWKSMQFQNGEFGRKRFKLMSQPFGFSGCANALEKVKRIVKEDISSWDKNNEVALHKEMMKTAINLITKTNFGCHFKDENNSKIIRELYTKVFTDFDDALLGVWSFGQGDAREKEFETNVEHFKLETRRIVVAHRVQRDAGDYFLAPFLDALLDNLDDEDEIIHHAITFMIGGFHTSGTYMTWLFYHLGLHQDIQKKVRDEIKEQLQGRGLESIEDMDKLPYTKTVMDETLRVVKLGPFSERQADRDVEIGGYLVRQGTQIMNSLCLTLDDSKTFPNPNAFDPQNVEGERSKGFAFTPFGFGVRKCPGYRFAYLESFVTAIALLSDYKIEVVDQENIVKPVYGFVTKPEREVWIRLHTL